MLFQKILANPLDLPEALSPNFANDAKFLYAVSFVNRSAKLKAGGLGEVAALLDVSASVASWAKLNSAMLEYPCKAGVAATCGKGGLDNCAKN